MIWSYLSKAQFSWRWRQRCQQQLFDVLYIKIYVVKTSSWKETLSIAKAWKEIINFHADFASWCDYNILFAYACFECKKYAQCSHCAAQTRTDTGMNASEQKTPFAITSGHFLRYVIYIESFYDRILNEYIYFWCRCLAVLFWRDYMLLWNV